MCQYCEPYGNGDKWYLNPENFARRLYKIRKPETEQRGADADPQAAGMGGGTLGAVIRARLTGEYQEEAAIKAEALERAYQNHAMQVVTLEEFLKILDIAYPIAKMTCACRRVTRGTSNEDNFSCMGIGPGMYKWERWPETYHGGVEFLTPSEAKEWAILNDKAGRVHTVDIFGVPYIGGLCQCEYPGCIGIRARIDYDFRILLKGEYVAKVNKDKCNGCKMCIARCNFKSIHHEIYTGTTEVEMTKCFGCGLCVTACKQKAIELIDRNTIPALKDNW